MERFVLPGLLGLAGCLGWGSADAADGLFDAVIERSLSADRELTEQRAQLLTRLRAAQQRVDWAEAGFIDVRHTRSEFPGQHQYYERARRFQQQSLQRLTTMPLSVSRHATTSGSSLNHMLDVLGPVAMVHEERLRRHADQLVVNKDPEYQAKIKLLIDIEQDLLFPPDLLEHLRFLAGQTGLKSSVAITFQQGVVVAERLPLNWSSVFQRPHYQPLIQRVAAARDALRQPSLPPTTTEGELFTALKSAIDELTVAFNEEYWSRMQRARAGGKAFGDEKQAYMLAKRQLMTLRQSAQRWSLEGRQPLGDAAFPRKLPGDQISLIQVLSLIHDRGWRFTEAPIAGQQDYQRLCEFCRKYYLSLAMLDASLNDMRDDLAHLEAEHTRHVTMLQTAMETEARVSEANAKAEMAKMLTKGLDLFLPSE